MTRDEEITMLARAMLDGEADCLPVYEALKPLLPVTTFVALGAALELCPVHLCDFQICVDDRVHGDEVYDSWKDELVTYNPADIDTYPSVCQFPEDVRHRFGWTGGEQFTHRQIESLLTRRDTP